MDPLSSSENWVIEGRLGFFEQIGLPIIYSVIVD
jgi:hypothetical protein